ncbi:unnamed protein product [Pieris macdunnoughi]|uniref:Uncharacterized protein n=1 Tax=Pieris macdunnoughi TaxID=345717 RepID=A0A821KNT4_9NEOP|nr:unnamed protein product [Pieris macdunnoughi]
MVSPVLKLKNITHLYIVFLQNTLEDVEGVSGDLISVLNREKISDSRHSDQLREFYKKLIETDAQIKKLKDSMFHNYQHNYDRFRRSVTGKHSKLHERSRSRKKKNASSPADGVFVKEEKFVIKYGPIRRNYPKCDPHDEKQHEAKLNHPFYKISQRFDEMLNKVDNNIKHDMTTENEPKNDVTEVRGARVYDTYSKDMSFKARKLLQVVEEEDLGYEDMKEVLSDDKHDDDIDQQLERLKRDESHNLPNVYNLNWKGPMLYPDEINAMIRDAALHNLQIPASKSNDKEYNSKRERELSDREYVQDYIDSKFDKLVGLAQAYSDYGVLDAKEKNTEKPFLDHRFIKKYGRSKKGFTSPSEGLRIEYRPGPANDNSFKKILEKHVKIVKPLVPVKPPKICNARMNIHFFTDNNKDIKLKPDSTVQAIEINPNADDKKKFEKDNPFKFKSRNLQSIDMSTDNVSLDNTEAVEIKPKVTEDKKEKENLLETTTLQSMDTKNEEKTSLGLGEFMSLLADWFFKMADASRSEPVNKSEVLLPTYDNDMVDNIGHRSRMLLQANVSDENITTSAAIVNTTLNTTTIMPNTTKAIVKRSADFIFWNDIYDEDEYGAKMDYFDVTNKDKGVLIKSKNWLQDKVKVAADKIKYDLEKTVNSITKVPKLPNRHDKPRNRPTRNTETNNEDFDVSKSFAKLNANLKHVCREAVNAVRSTRKVEAREDDTQATGLMQRLIQLMGDLVDIQVQQRTCSKLPADLRDFLEWLVVPDEQPSVDNLAVSGFNNLLSDGRYEKSPEAYDLPLTEDTHQEDRTECLGTIRAVQDLIQQYDGMSDDDKSKMAGVKEYLENQLQYLNRKLDKINEYEAINYRKRETRNKRNIHRRRRFFNKYLNFERKHTKTTIHTKMTKAKHASEINDKNVANDNVNDSVKGSLINNKNTRNLKDVYFKALDEAKKTTLKKI